MARIIGGIGTTHIPSSATRLPGLQRDPTGHPLMASKTHQWLAEVPDVVVVFTTITASILSRQDHDFRRRLRRIPPCRRGLGLQFPAVSEETAVLAPNRLAGGREFDDHVGDAGRSPSRSRSAVAGAKCVRFVLCRSPSTPCSTRCLRRRGASSSVGPSASDRDLRSGYQSTDPRNGPSPLDGAAPAISKVRPDVHGEARQRS